jgi:hypothetical protein
MQTRVLWSLITPSPCSKEDDSRLPAEGRSNAGGQFFRTGPFMALLKNRGMLTWNVVDFEAAFRDLGPGTVVGAFMAV